MKYLIAGLGNIGSEYKDTRHNIGFNILDAFAEASNVVFTDKRYGSVCETVLKGRKLILLKPSTYMNLSGNAVRYWLQKERVPIENLFVVVDDLALPFGTVRLRAKGTDGGHNGLKHINAVLGTSVYARLRFGIGKNFSKGEQIDYVLGSWSPEEEAGLPELISKSAEIIRNFIFLGVDKTMSLFNNNKSLH